MCIESKSCLCHRIKDFIITDKKGIFLDFFEQRKMIELHSFLKDSYLLIDPKFNSKKFDSHLQTLVLTYLKPNNDGNHSLVINVNHEETKNKFLNTYKKYQNHQRDKTRVLYRFEKLIHDVEKLAYNNLEENTDFMTHLQQETKKLRRSVSLRLPRFLHKKSPSSDGQAQESQAESSSPPSPSN